MNFQELMIRITDLLKTHKESGNKRVGQRLSPVELKKRIDFSLPEFARSERELLADMKAYLDFTPQTTTPHFQNQLFSGLNPYALAGDWLSAFTNSTMATYEVAPFATLAEKALIDHFVSKVGWPYGEGLMVTGGSNANFYGMLLARNTLYPTTKWEGLGERKLVAFVSEEAHYSFDKAANMLGLGISALKKVPADARGKMIPSELRRLILEARGTGEIPYFVGATAGTTVLGAYDPLEEISQVAREFNLWLHVDGAWGGSVLFSDRHRALIKGVEGADSLALDTHKMLGTGLISSFFLTKHVGALRKSNDSGGADYIFHESDDASYDTGPWSLQCGRRVDALKVWLMWRSLGDAGIAQLIERFFEAASMARDIIKSRPELVLVQDPEMLNVCFDFKDETRDVKFARERLLSEGSFYVNVSTRKGRTFFRMILVNPDLSREVIEKTIEKIITLGEPI